MKLVVFILFVSIDLSLQAQGKILLDEGTEVQVRLDENLNSKVSEVGDAVNLSVAEDVLVDDILVIKRGTPVTGRVILAKPAKWAGQKGKLDFTIDYVKCEFGKNINLQASNDAEGKSHMVGVIAAAAIVAPILLIIKGKDVTVPKGKIFTTYVSREYELDASKKK